MQSTDASRIELKKAKLAIDGMLGAASMEIYEECWKEYLRRIERAWNKTSNHYGKSPKWDSWQGRIVKKRREDSLLVYLVNARGADEHSVSEIVARQPGGIGINPAFGTEIRNLRIQSANGVFDIQSDTPLKIDFLPGKVSLLPVTNRGRTYPVPTSHLGKVIDSSNVVDVATLGLCFYEDVLSQAEAYSVK
ncbi:MAG TPA: hypothetical protein VLC92_05050 [Rhodocyclaceae bacterium]|nr:hypothetical protein [Rhodocyclaceae bacterium]